MGSDLDSIANILLGLVRSFGVEPSVQGMSKIEMATAEIKALREGQERYALSAPRPPVISLFPDPNVFWKSYQSMRVRAAVDPPQLTEKEARG